MGIFKVFSRDNFVKKTIYFCGKLVHIKYKIENFKTALFEILKQQEEQQRHYEQRLEEYEELFVELQRKMLTSYKNEDSGIFS